MRQKLLHRMKAVCGATSRLMKDELIVGKHQVDGTRLLIYIREYGSTLYVGLARAVSPTNTNFRLFFLLTQLQEALYEDLAV